MLSRRSRVILCRVSGERGNFLTRAADLSVNIRPATCIVSTRARATSYCKVFIVGTFEQRSTQTFPPWSSEVPDG